MNIFNAYFMNGMTLIIFPNLKGMKSDDLPTDALCPIIFDLVVGLVICPEATQIDLEINPGIGEADIRSLTVGLRRKVEKRHTEKILSEFPLF